MVAVSDTITERPDEGLSISGPVGLVVEWLGVPDDLVEELRSGDRVGGWALAVGLEGAGLGVGHVAHVVGRIQVLAIPAGGELDDGHDALLARGLGEVHGDDITGVLGGQAGVANTTEVRGLGLSVDGWVTNDHAETLRYHVRNDCIKCFI